jgi:hypothetical protein
MSDPLRQQGRALENQFFQHVDQVLLERIRQNVGQVSKREALANVSSVKDPQVLDALLALGIEATTFAALTFVPLAAVAWADGSIDAAERKAILQAAEQHGIHAGRPGYELLEHWIQNPVSAATLDAWKSYVTAMKTAADPATYASVRTEILGLAENVAKSSGGFLGLSTISAAEKQKLSEMQQAFDA